MNSNILRESRLLKRLKRLVRKLKRKPRHPLQDREDVSGFETVRLGTDYGGWFFVDEPGLKQATIISAGLGEDASFDVEFASRYDTRVIVVDPTPRSVEHFNGIKERTGQENAVDYIKGGCQPAAAYDLSKLSPSSLELIDKALWNEDTELRFFEPRNPRNVSHSIVNYQNDYRPDTNSITVEALTVRSLLDRLSLDSSEIPLVKLDIEGAEIEVIEDMLRDRIYPKQILVEFDELNVPSERGFDRVSRVDSLLANAGYAMIKSDRQSNFLYFRTGEEAQ